jgi:hypothetical protein
MNPMQALRGDWHYYYNGTFMRVGGQIMRIRVDQDVDGTVMYGQTSPTSRAVRIDPQQAEVWWPRTGAYDLGDGSCAYIGRMGYRGGKRSAHARTYKILWGSKPLGGMSDGTLYLMSQDQPGNVPWLTVQRRMEEGEVGAIRLTKELIVAINGTDADIVSRGRIVGNIRQNEFFPVYEGDPLCRLVIRKLEREGVSCNYSS